MSGMYAINMLPFSGCVTAAWAGFWIKWMNITCGKTPCLSLTRIMALCWENMTGGQRATISTTTKRLYIHRCSSMIPEAGRGPLVTAWSRPIDLAPTVLDFFGLPVPDDMLGHPLGDTIAEGKPVRSTCLWNLRFPDQLYRRGHYAYILAPADKNNNPLYNYTLMPTLCVPCFRHRSCRSLNSSEPFSFTKGCRLLKIKNQEKKEYLDEKRRTPL